VTVVEFLHLIVPNLHFRCPSWSSAHCIRGIQILAYVKTAGIESSKCRSEFHKLPLALLHSACRLASSYAIHYIFTWPIRHSPHPAMISTAHPFSGPTALAVALAGCCNFRISLNVHLMYRGSIMTAGQDRRCCYLQFLSAKVKTALKTAAQ
jgi:hypothetical protein